MPRASPITTTSRRYAVGEVKPIRGPGRREIGHGALAERALRTSGRRKRTSPIPSVIVSDITESNGSSSMASVCGGSLALMDAGVPIHGAVAGISIGWVSDNTGRYKLLTDIIGEEDHFGDMDFKIAGTTTGITAIQLDIKAMGLPQQIMVEALERAERPGSKILEVMNRVINAPRAELSKYAPKLITMEIDPEYIGKIIGPGGKMIKSLQEQTGYDHRDRRGRHDLHQLHGRRRPPQGQRDDRGDDATAGGRPGLQGVQGRLGQGIRRLRRARARRGRAMPRQRAERELCQARRGRLQDRGCHPGQAAVDRRAGPLQAVA